MRLTTCLLWAATVAALGGDAVAQESFVHGLWVWKTASLLTAPNSGEALRDFCRAQTVNEVYLSYSPDKADATEEAEVAGVITLLHRSGIQVEALLSSVNADEQGAHREKLLDHVRAVIEFNRKHASSRFDGIHLDVEPQQRGRNRRFHHMQCDVQERHGIHYGERRRRDEQSYRYFYPSGGDERGAGGSIDGLYKRSGY